MAESGQERMLNKFAMGKNTSCLIQGHAVAHF